jgi:hypothetical protein
MAYPGNGVNVIDQSSAEAKKAEIILDNNTTFELRQSITTLTFPYLFPVEQHGFLMGQEK